MALVMPLDPFGQLRTLRQSTGLFNHELAIYTIYTIYIYTYTAVFTILTEKNQLVFLLPGKNLGFQFPALFPQKSQVFNCFFPFFPSRFPKKV